jgi:hypothetical protein
MNFIKFLKSLVVLSILNFSRSINVGQNKIVKANVNTYRNNYLRLLFSTNKIKIVKKINNAINNIIFTLNYQYNLLSEDDKAIIEFIISTIM